MKGIGVPCGRISHGKSASRCPASFLAVPLPSLHCPAQKRFWSQCRQGQEGDGEVSPLPHSRGLQSHRGLSAERGPLVDILHLFSEADQWQERDQYLSQGGREGSLLQVELGHTLQGDGEDDSEAAQVNPHCLEYLCVAGLRALKNGPVGCQQGQRHHLAV